MHEVALLCISWPQERGGNCFAYMYENLDCNCGVDGQR